MGSEDNPMLAAFNPRQLAREREDPRPPRLSPFSKAWEHYYLLAANILDERWRMNDEPFAPSQDEVKELAEWLYQWDFVGAMDRMKERREHGPENWKQVR
jgi:hypothetical protein